MNIKDLKVVDTMGLCLAYTLDILTSTPVGSLDITVFCEFLKPAPFVSWVLALARIFVILSFLPFFFFKRSKDVSFHPFKGQIHFRRNKRKKNTKKEKLTNPMTCEILRHHLWMWESGKHRIAACSPKKVLHFGIWVRRSLRSFLTEHLIQSCTKTNYTGGTSKWKEKSVTCNCYQCWRKQVI